MTFKLLCKNKWTDGSFRRRFKDCRGSGGSSRVDEFREARRTSWKQNVEFPHGGEAELPVLFGLSVNPPLRAGNTCGLGNYSTLMAIIQKPGWMTVAGRLNQCKALATLTGDYSLECKKKRASYAMQMEIVKALNSGERSRASDLLQKHVKHSSRADNFSLILKYCSKTTDPLFAMETWRSIDERKMRMNRNFCMLMIQTLCKGGYLEEGLNMLHYLGENQGVYPMLGVYNYFLRASLKRKNSVYAGKCLDLMEQRLVGKNEHTYLELLKLAVLQKNSHAVHEIWKDYIKHYPANIPLMRYFIVSYIELRDLKAACEILQLMINYAVRGAAFGVKTVKGRFSFPKLDIPIPLKNGLSLKTSASGKVSNCSEEVDGLFCSVETTSILSERNIINHKSIYPIVDVLRSTFNDLIHACTISHDSRLAENLFQQMQNLGLEPSKETYDGLVKAVIYSKGFAAGMEVFKTIEKRNLRPRKATLATLSKACSIELELDLAEALLDQLMRCPYPYPYNALLKACTVTNELERALRVLSKMKQATAKPDIKTYELLFYLFGNVNHPYEKGNLLSQAVVARRIKVIEADMAKNGVQHSSRSIRNLLRALGHEGMIKEVIRYLRLAEDLFARNNMQLGTPVYNTVLYALTAAEENHTAIDMFKSMRRCGLALNDVTYNIMVDCCSNIQCFRSATALVSMMIRDGYLPHVMTYTALIKIHLDDKDYDEALYLLDRACSDSIKIDTLLFNTILKKSGEKGRIDLLEFIIKHMQRANIGPDASTCSYACAAYTDKMRDKTAIEALQVLSVRMITQEGVPPTEKRAEYEDFIFSEDPEAESQLSYLLEDYQDNIAFGLLNLRWCAILGLMDSVNWVPQESPWSQSISSYYEDLTGSNNEDKGWTLGMEREIRNKRRGKRFADYGNKERFD